MKQKVRKRANDGPIVPFAQFATRLKAVARGKEPAPEWAGKTVYATQSARAYWTQPETIHRTKLAALTKLLADNQDLLEAIRSKHPVSVSELARAVNRSDSNVSRSLGKLGKFGIVVLKMAEGRAKQPVLAADRVLLEVDVVSGQVAISRRHEPATVR